MGTLSASKISTTYKNLVFQKSDNKIYYTNGSDADTEITTFATALTLSGLITATAGIKLGNNTIYASDGGASITLDTSDNVTIAGDLTITGGNITNAITTDALLTAALGVKLGNNILYASDGGTAITLDTSDNVAITGDLTVSGGDTTIKAANDAAASILMQADNSDDAGDDWKVIANTDQTFTIGSDKASAGSYVSLLTITPHATAASSNVTIAGDLTISGGNITNALTLDSTLTVSSNTIIGGNLTFTGARDVLFTDGDGLEIKDTGGSTYFAMISDTIAVSQPMTCTGKVLLSGNTGPTAGTGITEATGEVYKSWVERYGTMIKTSILIDITGLRHSAAADIIGNDGTSNPCHMGQITAALNGAIFSGRMTCLEAPTVADMDLYGATEGTGVENGAIADLTEKQIINGGNQSLGTVSIFDNANLPAANDYLYLVCQSAGDADYAAGKFLIELWGTV
jgi:phage baseplate assembly protein gpV